VHPITSPRDLPELRLWLLDMWHGPFAAHAAASAMDHDVGDPRYVHLDARTEVHFLKLAELWWISPEMSTLVRRAAESLPPTTLTEDLIPQDRPVLAFFAEPLIGSDAAVAGNEMKVRTLMWYSGRVVSDPNPNHMYATVSMHADAPDYLEGAWPYVPVGRTDWLYGTDTEAPTIPPAPGDDNAVRLASMAEDRRWLAALALLAAEPLAQASIVRQTNKSKVRKLRRSGLPSDVRLVGLRTAPTESSGAGGHRKVEWSHRWIVGQDTGGFWKQVPYGPGKSLRRPKWIMPFEKGPKDKPLIIKDTVHVLREDR
jgi:hypothetical protein